MGSDLTTIGRRRGRRPHPWRLRVTTFSTESAGGGTTLGSRRWARGLPTFHPWPGRRKKTNILISRSGPPACSRHCPRQTSPIAHCTTPRPDPPTARSMPDLQRPQGLRQPAAPRRRRCSSAARGTTCSCSGPASQRQARHHRKARERPTAAFNWAGGRGRKRRAARPLGRQLRHRTLSADYTKGEDRDRGHRHHTANGFYVNLCRRDRRRSRGIHHQRSCRTSNGGGGGPCDGPGIGQIIRPR